MGKSPGYPLTLDTERLPLFLQAWWLDAVCENWRYVSLLSTGKPEAIWAYQLEKKWGLRLLRNPALCPYTGPVFLGDVPPDAEHLERLFQQLPQWDYLQFSTAPEWKADAYFEKKGMTLHRRRTFYIDLGQDEQRLFQAIHPRRRSYIRAASKQLRVEICKEPDIELFTRWHRAAFERKGKKYPYSAGLIDRLFRQGLQSKNAPFLMVRQANAEVLAMLWTPFDQEKTYHLLAAIQPGLRNNGAMDLLTWEAIRMARERGQRWYDFEGSMEEGIARFFRNFGGQEKSFVIFEQNRSWLWRLKKAWLG